MESRLYGSILCCTAKRVRTGAARYTRVRVRFAERRPQRLDSQQGSPSLAQLLCQPPGVVALQRHGRGRPREDGRCRDLRAHAGRPLWWTVWLGCAVRNTWSPAVLRGVRVRPRGPAYLAAIAPSVRAKDRQWMGEAAPQPTGIALRQAAPSSPFSGLIDDAQ